MTRNKPGCAENAIGMLESRPHYFIGWIGDIRYYVVDGRAWSRTLDGRVARSDDPEETSRIVRSVRALRRSEGDGP